jgi:sugar phosphate isomerase/epimerase
LEPFHFFTRSFWIGIKNLLSNHPTMNGSNFYNRRGFLKAGILGSAALGVVNVSHPALASLAKPERDPCHGLKLGLTSYTLRKFSLEQAVEMTKEAGVKYISLKDMHLPFKSTTAERERARRQVEGAGLTLLGGGVIYMKNDEAEIRSYFDYAREAGMPTIVCSPDPDALDNVEKMTKEFNIRIAIHNHGPGDKKYPSPLDILRLVKDRNELMGICMDVGHTVRIGEDPVEAIQKCRQRLYDFHIKDITEATVKGRAIQVGRGVIDIVGVLKELVSIKYQYHLALEYEANEAAPLPGVTESFGYIRGVLATI